MNAALALHQAMRQALLQHEALTALLGGAHVYDELPRGSAPPYVNFTALETRDWSVCDQKAHEHFVSLDVATNERGRSLAQAICNEIEQRLDNASIALVNHHLVNLRLLFWSVARTKNTDTFGATLRFRAATEPL
jgi:Protein of unknown function (DUF3168)